MDRLKQIETFVAVATRGSLTAAAQAEGCAGHHRPPHGRARGATGREITDCP